MQQQNTNTAGTNTANTNTVDSTDASLQSLTVEPGELIPGFWGSRKSFAVTLANSVDAVSIHATTTHPGARVRINETPVAPKPPGDTYSKGDTYSIEPGRTVFNIEVTAPDGITTRWYEVKVLRAAPAPNWRQVRGTSPWQPRDSAGELTFNNRMWLLGGYIPELVSDVWSSTNGDEWQQTGEIAAPAGINIPVTFAYDGKMWVSSNDGHLFASSDGTQWQLVSDNLPCLPRYGAGCAVFAGRMWILGGAADGTAYNDVWSSTDGIEWTQEVAVAPWSRRQLFGNVVVHDNKLWIIGGGLTNYQPFKAYRDIWCSADGREWIQVSDEAPWPARIWSSCAVYRNRIWLLGGFRAQPGWNNFNDVWYSSDGRHWQLLESEDIWSPRHELSAYVHDNHLWVVGGNAWPLLNDVWQLHLPGLTFISQPVLEEFVHCRYTYHARADFHQSTQALQYTLKQSPAWLSINPETGTIVGTPRETGDFKITVEAGDGNGETAQQSYTLSVITAG